METAKQVQKKYGSMALTLSIGAALLFILMGHKPIGKGLILGAIFSVLNFILMGQSIALNFGRSNAKTITLSMGSIFIRYLLLAIPMVAAIKYEQFNLVATILGIFMIQLVILAEHVFTLIPAMRKKQI
ncbi:MAG: ATP synthase subunit I [Deltaproteobacteria bacterium]|jgi:predicted KAP-like P-loop ATPase|nr:ATP synthase subunit I [Deltaproteobacteria bacterium]